MAIVLTALLWWKHAENIQRLLEGTEGRLGQKGSTAARHPDRAGSVGASGIGREQ